MCNHCRLHFVRIYISSLLVFSLSLSVILALVVPSSYPPPPTYTWTATKCTPAKTCTRMGHDDPPHPHYRRMHTYCAIVGPRDTLYRIHGRIADCKYAQYATTLLKTCRRGLALCTLVKHQHTLLSDISAVGSLDSLRGEAVIAYGVHTASDRGKAACECVYASV